MGLLDDFNLKVHKVAEQLLLLLVSEVGVVFYNDLFPFDNTSVNIDH